MELPTASVASSKLSAPLAQTPQLQASTDMAARRILCLRPGSKDLGVARTPRCHLTRPEAQSNPRAPSTPTALQYAGSAVPGPSRCQGRPSRLPARTCVGPAATSPLLLAPLSPLRSPPSQSFLTSFTERNSRSGKTRCRSRKCAMRVVKSYSAILPGERSACSLKLY